MQSTIVNSELGENEEPKIIKKEHKFMAWSCCMNTYKDSKGCRKQKINKHRWNLSNF